MATRKITITFFLAIVLPFLGPLYGCASSKPKPAVVTEQISAAATVVAVDQSTRELTLHSDKLGEFTVYAGPEVRNLPQVKPGETVNITYMQGVAAQLSDSKEASPGLTHAVVATNAPEGELPAATRGHTLSGDVVIENFDPNKNVVTFRTADGQRRVVSVQRPEVREFASKLKPGDVVTITFIGAIPAEVRPAAGATAQ